MIDITVTRIAKKRITPKQKKVTVLSVVGPASPTPLSARASGAAKSSASSAVPSAARTVAERVGNLTPGNLAQETGALVPCAP